MNPSRLTPELAQHLANSYPHNHDYRISGSKLRPSFQLWRRWRKLRKHYRYSSGPNRRPSMDSLLDLSSCKGFFVLDAAQRLCAKRVLGIDVHELDLEASRAAAAQLGLGRAHFEKLHLDELVERGQQPFETALLVNSYPYLYFGSRRDPHHYGDHGRIFELIAQLIAPGGRLIFSNRAELERCPAHIQELARERGLAGNYDERRLRDAATQHFRIETHGSLGRIPLWVLERR
ncbi:MAG: methyltransferase domain-containing protein [Planctomycetota bacterium]|nr:methyltransferase domain-containing protein [Planctomycetota bacterium]